MIRVLSIIHYPVFGGPHNRNLHVAPALKNKDVHTTVLLPNELGNAVDRLLQAGLDVETMPLVRLRAKFNPLYHLRVVIRFWGDVRRIRCIIRKRRIDVVQINGVANSQGAVAAKLERVAVVWQILDTFSPMILRRLMMLPIKWLADVVMCTGRQVADEHPGANKFGKRLVFFYPPVDLKRFTPEPLRRKQARKDLGISDDSFVVGTVGNINLQKGHRTFIRAAAQLKHHMPKARFVILGELHENHREYGESLWKEAATLGIKKGGNLIIPTSGFDVAELEPAFDIFWMTSEPRSEGIPTAIEEAMTLGVPVVATHVGSINEIVLEERTGFVVAPYDISELVKQSMRLYFDENLRQAMSSAAQEYATQNFSVESCAQSHYYAYELALTCCAGNCKAG